MALTAKEARKQARDAGSGFIDRRGKNMTYREGEAISDLASDVWEPIVAYWKDRCERAEEGLRLHVDEGLRAW